MRKQFNSIVDVLASPFGSITAPKPQTTDRVLKSTKLEDMIYSELRVDDTDMDELESVASQKLSTFSSLSRDVYQSFYSLLQKRVDDENLSTTARKLNSRILDHITESENYPTIKNICEGRDLPAYEAMSEFISQTANELDDLLSDLGGDKGSVNTLEKLEQSKAELEAELAGLLERLKSSKTPNATLEKAAVNSANMLHSKQRQVEAVTKLVDLGLAQNKGKITAFVATATEAAKEKAEEVQNIIGAWGDGAGSMERTTVNTELLSMVRQNPELMDISKYLGRFREMFAQGKKNGYAYGRGEKYSLELGRDLSRAITSELVMLSTPETIPLFLRKYQRGQIKQYQRREPIFKGSGDIICCLDESGSTKGDLAAWGKAVALTMLEIAADGGRKFALIHFSGKDSFKTDLFLPNEYTMQDKLNTAETFLDGGTDFETPLTEAVRLMTYEGFENADVVFITDGFCDVSSTFAESFREVQLEKKFIATGVLLDSGQPGMDFTIGEFCWDIYRTSEMFDDDIVREIVSNRV